MIETSRLVLRPWREEDRAGFAVLVNTSAMMARLGGLKDCGAVDALFDKRIADQAGEGLSYWAVELREGGTLIGSCGLRRANNYPATPVAGMIEAGWRIGEAWWRRGFAAEAGGAAIGWGWQHITDDRIGSWTTADNDGSLAVMARLGFVRRPAMDFDRPETGERCLVHVLERPLTARFRHETDRLILRDWRSRDADTFYEHLNTPAVMRWLGGVQNRSVFDAAVARIEGYRRDYGHTFWIVERKPDGGALAGELIGFCGLKRSNVEGEKVFGMVEVGWRLREDAWGHGYAKEGAIASLELAFERFDASEVVALTVAGNAASRGLMERLGMTRRPDLDFNDPRYGEELNPNMVWAITLAEWQAIRETL